MTPVTLRKYTPNIGIYPKIYRRRSVNISVNFSQKQSSCVSKKYPITSTIFFFEVGIKSFVLTITLDNFINKYLDIRYLRTDRLENI